MSNPAPSIRPVVLLVEDEPIVRMAAADALKEAGFDVVEAADAQAAEEMLRERRDIRVLFTDVQMPGAMDGLGLASLVHGSWPHICIILTSSSLFPDDRDVPERAVFIAKPYAEQAPARAIRGLLDIAEDVQ